MTDDKTLGRKAVEQKQRAARHDKLERSAIRRTDGEAAAHHNDRAKNARNAEGMYRAAKRLTGKP